MFVLPSSVTFSRRRRAPSLYDDSTKLKSVERGIEVEHGGTVITMLFDRKAVNMPPCGNPQSKNEWVANENRGAG